MVTWNSVKTHGQETEGCGTSSCRGHLSSNVGFLLLSAGGENTLSATDGQRLEQDHWVSEMMSDCMARAKRRADACLKTQRAPHMMLFTSVACVNQVFRSHLPV